MAEDEVRREECGHCYGAGEADCPLDWGDDECPDSCHVCGGEQLVRCPVCKGTGYEEEFR